MDWPMILVKIAGVLLFGWTGYSVYRHVKSLNVPGRRQQAAAQSISERILNNILLYLWLAFMTVFSIGMIVNN